MAEPLTHQLNIPACVIAPARLAWPDPRRDPCPYCDAGVVRIDSSRIYNKNYGWVWACSRYPECDAFVGCHQVNKEYGHDGTEPKGRLADPELRELKKTAHALFDPLWLQHTDKGAARRAWYGRIARGMGIHRDDAHIGIFNATQCRRLIHLLKEKQL